MRDRFRIRLALIATLSTMLVVGACSSDDDSSSGDTVADVVEEADPSDDEPGIDEPSVGEADLVVPREYLQGEWCDSDGQSWSIEGSLARLVIGEEQAAELPIDLLFIDDVENELVSQADDEFVAILAGEEITFVRGSC